MERKEHIVSHLKISAYIHFARPFTLLAPILGVVSGALTAWGSRHNVRGPGFDLETLLLIVVASLAAGLLNAASNGINQIYDLEIDKINKPERPLASGAISHHGAFWFTIVLYILSVAITWVIVPYPGLSWTERLGGPLIYHACFLFYAVAALFTIIYSVPRFGRTKRMTWGANLTIAIPRGLMLKVAGWSVLAPVDHWEPWYIGSIFFLFLIGAASTKDFSDMEGDLKGGCMTLPNRYGVRKAAYLIAPCFVLPWLLIPLGVFIKPDGVNSVLSGDPEMLFLLGTLLTAWGSYTLYLILRDPDALSRMENHPSWKHMYLMMLLAQIGFAAAYLVDL